MYLWNARRLALALRAGRLKEADKARYLVALTVLSSLGAGSGLAALQSTVTALTLIGSVAMAAAGIWICFRASQRGDGNAFVERCICLMVPVTVRWLALFWGLWAGLAAIGFAIDRDIPGAAFGRWYGLLLLPVFYAMLHNYVALAARPPDGGDG